MPVAANLLSNFFNSFRSAFFSGLFLMAMIGLEQSVQIDSLKQLIGQQQDDSLKVNSLLAVSQNYFSINPDSAIVYAGQAMDLAAEIGCKQGEKVWAIRTWV